MKSVGHNARAQKSSERADARWEKEHGGKLEALRQTDHRLAIGEITQQEREEVMEVLFAGFSEVKRHVAKGWRGIPQRNIREFAAEEHGEDVSFRQLYAE